MSPEAFKPEMEVTVFRRCLLHIIAAVLLGAAGAAQASPFTLARTQTDKDMGNPDPDVHGEVIDTSIVMSATAPVMTSAGTPSVLYAITRTEFGGHHSFAQAVGQPIYHHAFGTSIWSDGFTVVGGTGSGDLLLSVGITGTLSGALGEGDREAGWFYALFVSATPFSGSDLLGWLDHVFNPDEDPLSAPPNSQAIFSRQAISFLADDEIVDSLMTGTVNFTFGETFYLASAFEAEADATGTSDFFSSVLFGITPPPGATLMTLSGVEYPLAAIAQVAEPSVLPLLVIGLAALGLRRRYARQRRELAARMERPIYLP